ncbi:hypothetical protein DFQ27_000176 [Actinomortierella ambigua]|uniref:Uncharacterized protein n=1 Tax=Actinomortierella ambigua TaxID=1343610 RepID=A0A9P6PLE5_9FUNG|nr:hypothetical protein DFQ27_000176 [Actinomortierella ambigua]
MYAYYAATSIGLHPPPGKKYFTSMQISQFLVAVSYLLVPGYLPTKGMQMAVWINRTYSKRLVAAKKAQ